MKFGFTRQTSTPQKRISTGLIYMILAAFFFSLMAATVKAMGHRIPSQELVLARSIILFSITALMIKKYHLPFWGRNRRLLLFRGLFGFMGLSAFFFTLTHIPIADSVVIQYTSPLFTALLAPFLLKEPGSRKQWVIFLIAFSGILLIVRPGFSLTFIPASIGLFGAFSAGIAYNLIRKLRQTEHPLNIILYLPAVSIPLSLPIVATHFVMPVGTEWIWLTFIGIFTFIAQVFLTKSLHLEKAALATNASYISIVFSTLWGFIFWSEIPDLLTLVGALIIIIAIYQMAVNR